ncbi:MAG TPA: hydantoinase/oxoprolinase family protein, partial [Thermoleophilaceae bacterium]|nr:hydantoinase/oxoprolinase family protein [Thermoleophilaceae bacterium]
MSTRIGVDVGGTFTDLIAYDDETGEVMLAKSASTADAREAAVIESVSDRVPAELIRRSSYFLHGTTVGLNSLLTRTGARLGLLATSGFRDVLEIRRGSREQMLNLWWRPPAPLVPRALRIPIRERTRADGSIIRPLDDEDVAAAVELFAREGVEAVAVAFINSYRNPANELAAAEALVAHGFEGEISLSHQVSGEYREFERTSTTVIDAYVRGVTSGYLERLRAGLRDLDCPADLLVMRSGGGAMGFDEAAARPFETILSGPVAGVEGAASLARDLELAQVIAADVGGTSFDVSVVLDGRPQAMNEGEVIGFPVQAPWVDVRSIGAGGGSIAEIDAGGLLRVGPRSSGSVPGPACYGRGGTEATVTDAAFALGMLGDGRLAGGLRLDPELADAALSRLAAAIGMDVEGAAQGIMRVAAAHMADAIHEITVERGLDPRDGALMTFGGAGGLFATLLASESAIPAIVVPPFPGNFSAWGLLGADITQTAAQTMIAPLSDETAGDAARLLSELLDELRRRPGNGGGKEAEPAAALDLRYAGQEYSLTLPIPYSEERGMSAETQSVASAFVTEYEKIFGHRMEEDIEIVAVRGTLRTPMPERVAAGPSGPAGDSDVRQVRAFSFTAAAWADFSLVGRDALGIGEVIAGPALIAEETAMTYLDGGFRAS